MSAGRTVRQRTCNQTIGISYTTTMTILAFFSRPQRPCRSTTQARLRQQQLRVRCVNVAFAGGGPPTHPARREKPCLRVQIVNFGGQQRWPRANIRGLCCRKLTYLCVRSVNHATIIAACAGATSPSKDCDQRGEHKPASWRIAIGLRGAITP